MRRKPPCARAPANAPPPPRNSNKLFQRQKFSAAAQTYTEAITLAPDTAALYVNRALCYKKLGGGEAAWERIDADARRAVELDARSLKGNYLRGGWGVASCGWVGGCQQWLGGGLPAVAGCAVKFTWGAWGPKRCLGPSRRRRCNTRTAKSPPPQPRRNAGVALRELGGDLGHAISHLGRALEEARAQGDAIKDEIW